MPPLFEELKQIIEGEIFSDNESLTKASRDNSPFIVRPQIIIYPKNILDIEKTVLFSKKYGIPFSPKGAGNGARGGALTDGIVIDLSRYFDKIEKIDRDNGTVSVGAGMLYRELEGKMENWGIHIPFSRGSEEEKTIGGMVANGYRSPNSLMYGGIIDWIEGIKVVLDDGKEYLIKKDIYPEGRLREIYDSMLLFLKHEEESVRAGRRAVEHQSQGYEIYALHISPRRLIEILVGSGGTLGIITEIIFRLTPQKIEKRAIVVRIRKMSDLKMIQQIFLESKPLSIEGFDKAALAYSQNIYRNPSLEVHERDPFTVFAIYEGDTEEVKKKIENTYLKLGTTGENKFVLSGEEISDYIGIIEKQKSNLKHSSLGYLETITLLDDLSLPILETPELILEIESLLLAQNLTYSIAVDLGNGVLKIVYLGGLSKATSADELKDILVQVSQIVRRVRGTMSHSSGDGIAMTPLLPFIFGSKLAATMKALKFIWDPNNIFNPGKKTSIDFSYFKKHIDHLPPGLKRM